MRVLAFLFFLSFLGCASLSEQQEKAALHQKVGVSFFEAGNYPRALAAFLTANELDPDNASIQNNLGLTYFMRERYDLSEKHFRRALEIEPSFTDARNNFGRLLIEVNRFSEAEVELKKVLSDLTYPALEKVYINMGLCYFNQKKYDQAREYFLKAVEEKQDSCVANNYYGRSLFELNDYKRALPALDRAVSYCQKSLYDEPHYYSALTNYRMGEVKRSISRFEEVTKLYPNGRYNERSRAMLEIIRKGTE